MSMTVLPSAATPVRAESGAAAFFAMREYEKHQAENGDPPSHEFAKELMAGIAGAEVGYCGILRRNTKS